MDIWEASLNSSCRVIEPHEATGGPTAPGQRLEELEAFLERLKLFLAGFGASGRSGMV